MGSRKRATSSFFWTFLILATETLPLLAIQCPHNASQLLEKLDTEAWSAQDVHYDARVFLNDLSENPEVSSESTLRLSLRREKGSGVVTNCSYEFPLDTRPLKELSNSWETAEKVLEGVTGSLFYKRKEPHPLWIQNALFPVAPGKLSLVKATYAVSVAVPVSRNYTVLSNMPLESVEPLPNKPGWMWNHYWRTPPLWQDRILVMVMDDKDLRVVRHVDTAKNRTLSVYWESSDHVHHPNFEEDILCTARVMARLLSHFEDRFNDNHPLPKVDVVVNGKHSAFQALAYDTQSTGFLHSSGRACKKSGKAHYPETWEWFDSLMNQWFGYLTQGDSSLYLYLKRRLIDRFLQEAVTLAPEDNIDTDKLFPTFPSSAITLLESVVTKPVFEHGLFHNFMGKLKLKESALGIEDFPGVLQLSLETLNKTHLLPSGVTVPHLLQNWMNSSTSAGLPRILVTHNETSPGTIGVSQEAYDGYLRWIPLDIVTDTQEKLEWMPAVEGPVNVEVTDAGEIPQYIFFNSKISGEFQVVYDAYLMRLITTQLAKNPNTIPSDVRKRLMYDHVELLAKHRASIESVFDILKYFEYENDPEIWNSFIHGVLKGHTSHLQLYGTTKSRLQNFLGSIIDKALARQGITSVEALLSGNVTDLNPITLKIIDACITASSPTCVRFAKQLMEAWKAEPTLSNPFKRFYSDKKFECLALRNTHPTDELSRFFLAQDDNHDSSYCKAIWCTGNETLIMENIKSVFEDGPSLYKEKKCSPLFGYVTSQIQDDRLEMIEPVYHVMKEAILTGKLLKPSQPDMSWAYWGDSFQKSSYQVGDFIKSKTHDGDAVPKNLDNLLEGYNNLYNSTKGEGDNPMFQTYKGILEESVSYAKWTRTTRDERTSRYAQKILQLLEKEGF